MSLHFHGLNIWAVLVSIVAMMVIGALWYSPVLFGNTWMKLIGKKSEDISKKDGNKSMAMSIIPAIVQVLSLALLFEFVHATKIVDGLIIASLIAIGFLFMNMLNLVLFEGRSMKLTILNAGYPLVALNVVAIILVLWQ